MSAPSAADAVVVVFPGAPRAFVSQDPVDPQSTGFVPDPGGNVVVSVYSSGAVGRFVPEDVVSLVRYARVHMPSLTGVNRRETAR